MTWEPVIGLEIHVSQDEVEDVLSLPVFGAEPNTQTCPSARVPGRTARHQPHGGGWTVKLGLALDCAIAAQAVFSRKNYFYFDNLLSDLSVRSAALHRWQGATAYCRGRPRDRHRACASRGGRGQDGPCRRPHGRIRGADASLVDFNRCGTPLVEIVTQPDIRSAEEAKRFLQLLRQTIVELDLRRRDGEGHAARRCQRLRPPGRFGRAGPAPRSRT